MVKFDDNGRRYQNVNEVAEREGLIWDGHYGGQQNIAELVKKELRDEDALRDGGEFSAIFDHTQRFKPRGSGAKKPVMAITSPYANEDDIRPLVFEFANRFGLDYRVNEPRDRLYTEPGTIPIVFWRSDLHDFVG